MGGLDFGKLKRTSPADTATEPRRIFSGLPSKASKYSYPRDVQSEVWEQWHSQRDQPDLVIKMNTGSGKTVVGLVILKSCLNERIGPAVYVTPDIYLSDQVAREADGLGLETSTDPQSARFRTGKAILICIVYKLVNGLSQFVVAGSSRQPIELGTVLIDDVHAALTTVQEQFSLRIEKDHPTYAELQSLLAEDLTAQSRAQFLDIRDGVPSGSLACSVVGLG